MSVPPDDRGLTLGHGLFETLLWAEGGFVHWDAHLDRLARGCPLLGLPAPDRAACRREAEAALAAAGSPERAAVRLTWTAGSGGRGLDLPATLEPRLLATAAALVQPQEPATLATATVRRNHASPASRLKTLGYLDNVLARAEARAAGAGEALMLNTRGEVACAAAANVFWIEGGVVRTPALDCGVLDGIVRGQVLRACARLGIPAEEVRVGPEALAGVPVFLTNSLIGVRPVASLDGRELPTSDLVAALARAVG
ncbi:aminotransferase class IV [Phenylobacterium sp.]|uniref:aminotransferase class IV n=1 Tax=Phenylobacterium sp. TaxID=1871053 RepID=UPI002810C726|nr:aminotransferase class IV [Phenylobacterium sp.]